MTVGVYDAGTSVKQGEEAGREWLQRGLLDLEEGCPDLLARGAVDAQPRDGPIPVAQVGILLVEVTEAPPLERIAAFERRSRSYRDTVSRRTPVSASMRRSDRLNSSRAITCCRFFTFRSLAKAFSVI